MALERGGVFPNSQVSKSRHKLKPKAWRRRAQPRKPHRLSELSDSGASYTPPAGKTPPYSISVLNTGIRDESVGDTTKARMKNTITQVGFG